MILYTYGGKGKRLMADLDQEKLGAIAKADGYFEAHFERTIAHNQNTVWDMLTDPAQFVDWLAPGEIDLCQGGRAKLVFADSGTIIDSTVSACEPPGLLEYSWSNLGEPERPVRWETAAVDDGCRLMLTVRVPEDEDIARTSAGWEAHLAMLLAALEGAPIEFPFELFQTARELYKSEG